MILYFLFFFFSFFFFLFSFEIFLNKQTEHKFYTL